MSPVDRVTVLEAEVTESASLRKGERRNHMPDREQKKTKGCFKAKSSPTKQRHETASYQH